MLCELGHIYFWTATINKWQLFLEPGEYKELIIQSLKNLSDRKLIDVFGLVIMPNHVHLIWRINEMNGKELPSASLLKFTSHKFKKLLKECQLQKFEVTAPNKQYEFWQHYSLATELYTPNVIYQKLDYIHNNPVSGKWLLSDEPALYHYSSVGFYLNDGNDFGFLKHIGNEL